MADPGFPWEVENSKIVEAINNAKGRITHAAKLLNVKYETLKKKLDAYPELQEALKQARMNFEEQILDIAETCVTNAIANQAADANNALKAAMFTLNSKGRSRNWNNTYISDQTVPNEQLILKDEIIARQKYEILKLKEENAIRQASNQLGRIQCSDQHLAGSNLIGQDTRQCEEAGQASA